MNEYTCYESLTESAVFVTGGASGIGAAIVRAFVAQGARVGFVDVDVGAATELLTDLGPEGEVWFRQVDVSDVELLKSTIQQFAETCGGLDVLINNVANDNRHSVEDVTQVSWRNTMAVNLDATFFACQKPEGPGAELGIAALKEFFKFIFSCLRGSQVAGFDVAAF